MDIVPYIEQGIKHASHAIAWVAGCYLLFVAGMYAWCAFTADKDHQEPL